MDILEFEKRYQKQALLFSTAVTSILIALFIWTEFTELQKVNEREYTELQREIRKIFNFEVSRLNRFYDMRLRENIDTDGVKIAVERGDRDELYRLILPKFKILSEENSHIQNMHFHSADGVSILRMHKPESSGDNIGSKREMLKKVRATKESVYGFEEGIYGIFYRIIKPIFKGDRYIGSVEIGIEAEHFEDMTKELCPYLSTSLLIEKSRIKLYEKRNELVEYGNNYYVIGSHSAIASKLLAEKSLDETHFLSVLDGKSYMVVSSLYIYGSHGNQSVRVVAIRDVSNLDQLFNRNFITLLILALMFYILAIVMVHYTLKIYSKKLHKLNDSLYKTNNELDSLFNRTPDGIAILDLNYKFIDMNPAYTEITGFSRDELQGMSCLDITAPEDYRTAKTKLDTVIADYTRIEKYYKNCVHRDGHKIHIGISISMLPDNSRILVSTRDLTEKKRLEDHLERYVEIVDQNVITSTTDLNGNIVDTSSAFCRISGYSKEELIGQYHNIIKHPDVDNSLYKDLWDTVVANQVWRGEIMNRNRSGGTYWVLATIYPLFDWEGKKIGYTAIRQDITDKKRVEELSIRDELTGLYNRRHFNDVIVREIKRARRSKSHLSFMILDVDFFKQYNDTYGHQAGDSVLRMVADVLQDSLKRGSDFAFRLGGEEFGIIFSEQDLEKSLLFANSVRDKIESLEIEHSKSSVSGFVTTSVGLFVEVGKDIPCEDEIYRLADNALYKAKESGRNRCVVAEVE